MFAHAVWVLPCVGVLMFSPSVVLSETRHGSPEMIGRPSADERLRNIEALRELVAREPDNIGYRIRLGWWLVEVDKLEEAQTHFKKALELDPNHLDAVWGLATVHQGKGDNETAVEVLREYLRRRPGDRQAQKYLAEMSGQSKGTLDLAVREYQQMLERNPGDIETAKKLGKALVGLKRYEDAIAHYDRLVKAYPEDRALRLERARVLSWAKRYEASLAEYDALLAAEPGNRVYLWETANVLTWAGMYEEAVPLYQRILEQDPRDTDVRLALAEALNWSGRRAEAIREFEEILAVDPKNRRARLGLAQALSWSGKVNGAIRVFEEIKKEDPKNVDASLGLADAYWRVGDAGRAEAEYRQVLALDPANGEAKERVKVAQEALSARADLWYAAFFDSNDFVRQGAFGAFTWYPTAEFLVEIGNAFSWFDQRDRDIQRETPSLKIAAKPSPYLDLTLGYKFNAYLDNGTTNNVVAGLSYRAFDATTVGFTFNRLDIVDSKGIFAARGFNPITDIEAVFRKIQSNDFTPSFHHDFNDRFALDGSYTFGDQSDGNEKNEAFAQLSYRALSRPDRSLDVRGNVYYLGYKDQSPLYFSPSTLVNPGLMVGWHHDLTDRFSYDVENTVQYEYLSGDSGVANQFLGRVRYKITNDMEVSVSGFSFVESVNSYSSGSFLVGLSYRF